MNIRIRVSYLMIKFQKKNVGLFFSMFSFQSSIDAVVFGPAMRRNASFCSLERVRTVTWCACLNDKCNNLSDDGKESNGEGRKEHTL